MSQGYLDPLYASSFAEFGEPRRLVHSSGWVLEREIPDSDVRDAMGLYPLFCCEDWSALSRDLGDAGQSWISLAVVTDPLGEYDQTLLERTFDIVLAYKEHYIADTRAPLRDTVSRSHLSNARRALRKVDVEVCDDPASYVDDWVELFAVLAEKHAITGLRAFSRDAFTKQLQVPGLVMFRADRGGRTVGFDLWFVQDDIAQGHLVAFSEEGYALRASYATKWTLLNYFANRVRWVNFGGLPGVTDQLSAGLRHFKRGWSNTTKTAYFCGRIFDPKTYSLLSERVPETTFFPAYRAGEYSLS